jgi:hypothetical protein
MDKKAFAELVSSVRDMGCHLRGEKVARVRVTRICTSNRLAIRRQADEK